MRRLLLIVVALAGCGRGGGGRPAPPPARGAPADVAATPAADDDPVVARVDGRPVYGSCVAEQVRGLGVDREAALRQCIDFELLAGAADARALRSDPEVVDAWRREMVRAVIVRDLGPIQHLTDLPQEFLQPRMARAGRYLQRPYMRIAYFARFPVAAPADEAAVQAAAEELAAAYADQDAVLWGPFLDDAARIAAAHKVPVDVQRTPYQTPIEDVPGVRTAERLFRDALGAIPAMGRTSPALRGRDGWFVILWWDELPPADMSDSFFGSVRVAYFKEWVDGIAAALGLTPWIDEALLATLAEQGGA